MRGDISKKHSVILTCLLVAFACEKKRDKLPTAPPSDMKPVATENQPPLLGMPGAPTIAAAGGSAIGEPGVKLPAEPTTVVPATEPTTVVPATEPTTVVPATEPTTVVPATEPTTVVPATEPTTVVPVTDPPVVDPGPLNMAPVKFERNVKVSRGRGVETTLDAGPDGLIFVGWVSGRGCAFGVSDDGGATWGRSFSVESQANNSQAFAGDTAVATDDAGNLYAGCQDYASGGLGTNYVLLAHSKDKGKSWSDFKRVNTSLDKPWLGATGDGTVLLSWLGDPGGVKRSTDYGLTWEEPISLGFINHGTTISFAAETGLVHVAYNTREDTVTYRRSKDLGRTFERARDLADQGRPCRSPCSPRSHPIVGAGADPSGQVVAITWASRLSHPDAENDDDVWVIVSYDAGDTFSDPIRVNDNRNPSRQFQPWAAVDPHGAVHVTWTDLRDNGQNATYYARMVDPKVGFEPNVEVTDSTGQPDSFLGDYKGIDVQGRDVVISWADSRSSGPGIYFARALDAAAAGGPLAR